MENVAILSGFCTLRKVQFMGWYLKEKIDTNYGFLTENSCYNIHFPQFFTDTKK